MARLNEPTGSMESVESLKRRFLRQNREIARANSTQSLRIRSLENEVSKLLGENLGLREQISRYQNDLENSQTQRMQDNAQTVKLQLEEKLLELSSIISGLGRLHKAEKRSPKGRIRPSYGGQTAEQGRRKSATFLHEAAADQDRRLPPILENKSYPRRTLEREDILDIVNNIELDSTDSPEIGPPPVSQFVNEDPLKIDLPKRNRQEVNDETSEIDAPLSVNLEQRRKRKDITELPGPSESSKTETIALVVEGAGALKAGAKRKLCVREDDEDSGVVSQAVESSDEFKYSRGTLADKPENRGTSHTQRPVTKTTRELAVAKGVTRKREPIPVVASHRKALEPKSVNSSPKKAGKVLVCDDGKPAKPIASRSISVMERHERRHEAIPDKVPGASATLNAEVESEPETPAGVDLFSPTSSQPSTIRAESRDTPPPQDLGPGTEGQRPSRRARGAVSYAEPNLRDKMRRPSKGLIDAVVRGDKIHRNSLIGNDDVLQAVNAGIKSETDENESWKKMPVASTATVENSPLKGKVSVPEALPSSITTHRKRRESLLQQVEVETHRLGSGSAIAALLAETRKAKAAAKEKGRVSPIEGQVPETTSKPDIYDFKDTCPHSNDVGQKSEKPEKISSRVSRRHTSAPRDLVNPDDSEASEMEAAKKPSSSTSRRRQSTLEIRAPAASTSSTITESGENSLKRSASTTSVLSTSGDDTRHDRISVRRRSMIL